MAAELSFFRRDGQALLPTEVALSSWGHGHVHGVAISGALGREVERTITALGRSDLTPTRFAVDLFRPAKVERCELTATVVREGPRLALVDVVLTQQGEPVARASTIFLKASVAPAGEVWQPEARPEPPPDDVVAPSAEARVPFLCSDAGWTQNFGEHQNAARKSSWTTAVPIVAGEPLTPFQAVASAADGVNMVTSWGTNGVEYINSDLTLTLARRPVGTEIGLQAADRLEHDGIAVGSATVFDRAGVLGTVIMSAVANVKRTIDMSARSFDRDGSRLATPGA